MSLWLQINVSWNYQISYFTSLKSGWLQKYKHICQMCHWKIVQTYFCLLFICLSSGCLIMSTNLGVKPTYTGVDHLLHHPIALLYFKRFCVRQLSLDSVSSVYIWFMYSPTEPLFSPWSSFLMPIGCWDYKKKAILSSDHSWKQISAAGYWKIRIYARTCVFHNNGQLCNLSQQMSIFKVGNTLTK